MLEMQALSLYFGTRKVLQNIDFTVRAGQCIGLIGPSGAGKSTLLRLAAGLLQPTHGRCLNRFQRTRLVFQDPRLLPWRSVAANLDLALQAAGIDPGQAPRRRDYWLDRVGLKDAAQAWPAELSGGMAQRASLARALALEPDLLLLDEPFSALDPGLRADLGQLCSTQCRATQAAMICISHQPWELNGLVDHIWEVSDTRLRPLQSCPAVPNSLSP